MSSQQLGEDRSSPRPGSEGLRGSHAALCEPSCQLTGQRLGRLPRGDATSAPGPEGAALWTLLQHAALSRQRSHSAKWLRQLQFSRQFECAFLNFSCTYCESNHLLRGQDTSSMCVLIERSDRKGAQVTAILGLCKNKVALRCPLSHLLLQRTAVMKR